MTARQKIILMNDSTCIIIADTEVQIKTAGSQNLLEKVIFLTLLGITCATGATFHSTDTPGDMNVWMLFNTNNSNEHLTHLNTNTPFKQTNKQINKGSWAN